MPPRAGFFKWVRCLSESSIHCFLGQTHLDSLTFNLLNQTKTLSAALICYLLLGRRQSLMQCLALFLLFLSALLLSKRRSTESTNESFWLGVLPVLVAVLSSGLTAALTQRALKGAQGRSIDGSRAFKGCILFMGRCIYNNI